MNAVAYEMRLVFTAVQYLTRLPVPAWTGYSPAELKRSARYFPLVGIVVGAITGLVFMSAHGVLPQTVATLIAIGAGVLITGGFHEDGLADACDGLFGGTDKDHVLAIMKDSRVGTYAVLGLTLALLLKFACLSALPAERFLAVVIAAHAFSRFMSVSVMYTQHYVRGGSTVKAVPAQQRIAAVPLSWAAMWAVVPLWFLGAAGLAAGAAALLARAALARYFHRRIGGYTGDCLGAVQQASEVAFYLGVLAWIST